MMKISHAASPTALALANRFSTLTSVGAVDDRGFVAMAFAFFGG